MADDDDVGLHVLGCRVDNTHGTPFNSLVVAVRLMLSFVSPKAYRTGVVNTKLLMCLIELELLFFTPCILECSSRRK